jgi:hypothetical protein
MIAQLDSLVIINPSIGTQSVRANHSASVTAHPLALPGTVPFPPIMAATGAGFKPVGFSFPLRHPPLGVKRNPRTLPEAGIR